MSYKNHLRTAAAVALVSTITLVNANDVQAAETYRLNNKVSTYINADNASKQVKAVSTYNAGNYYVYKKHNGMINISTKAGVAGGWINPADNVKAATPDPKPAPIATPAPVAQTGTYKLESATKVYINATNAAKSVSPVGTYAAGTYHIYKTHNGMINISRTKGRAGAWINPDAKTSPVSNAKPAPTPVAVEDSSAVVANDAYPVNMSDRELFNYFVRNGFSKAGAAGIMGNLWHESHIKANNLQGIYNTRFGMTDAQYTAAVDNGSYKNFVNDKAGYGLAQWTWWTYKRDLLNIAKAKNVSVGNKTLQAEFLLSNLKTVPSYNKFRTTNDVRVASNIMLLEFERPADKGERVQNLRYQKSLEFYNLYK